MYYLWSVVGVTRIGLVWPELCWLLGALEFLERYFARGFVWVVVMTGLCIITVVGHEWDRTVMYWCTGSFGALVWLD